MKQTAKWKCHVEEYSRRKYLTATEKLTAKQLRADKQEEIDQKENQSTQRKWKCQLKSKLLDSPLIKKLPGSQIKIMQKTLDQEIQSFSFEIIKDFLNQFD